ncbi:hypothetical protein [Priestia megaterium]|uniref:hypothetical protein n=1 Tax=Priestia megaterium TaxID=1404 RepID=UPI001374C8F2|nr:hypothetical protein [Priestia megaterium]MDH3168758.1 hypothetical protein [Priestia megaterium]
MTYQREVYLLLIRELKRLEKEYIKCTTEQVRLHVQKDILLLKEAITILYLKE